MKVAITGAASGIGRATGQRLQRDGWEVVAIDRERASVEDRPWIESWSTIGRRIENGTRPARRMSQAGTGTASCSHSSAGLPRETSRSQRVTTLKPRVTNSHA